MGGKLDAQGSEEGRHRYSRERAQLVSLANQDTRSSNSSPKIQLSSSGPSPRIGESNNFYNQNTDALNRGGKQKGFMVVIVHNSDLPPPNFLNPDLTFPS